MSSAARRPVPTAAKRNKVAVVVRIRPLTRAEKQVNETELAYDVAEAAPAAAAGQGLTSTPTSTLTLNRPDQRAGAKPWRCRGLACVLEPGVDNATVYGRTLRPLVQRVIEGETACCFAYGHTGAGKSHTILGYGSELGLYHHAAAALCEAIRGTPLVVQLRLAELYQGKLYDLLDSRAECFLREDGAGNVCVRSATQMDAAGRVRVQSLQSASARTVEEVVAAVHGALSQRAVGSSGVHDQSSRSHAVLELELVTAEVVAAREAVLQAEATLVPIGKARDGKLIACMMKKTFEKDAVTGEYKETGSSVTREDEDELADLEARVAAAEQVLRAARDDEQRLTLEARNTLRQDASAAAAVAAAADSAASSASPRAGGCGTLVFVDLAGAEYATTEPVKSAAAAGKGPGQPRARTPLALSEAKEINSSLLALKEVVRALAKPNSAAASAAAASGAASSSHIPYRNSKLTMLLRRHLSSPSANALMIANMSLSAARATASANTMQYAELVADAGK